VTDAQAIPNTNMVPHKEIEIDNNISVPSEQMYTTHRKFRERIDQFAEVQTCHVCQESYAGVQIRNTSTGPMCLRCLREGSNHIFSVANHMDPGFQPRVLQDLTQVEEMLIARASPILQVMHSIGGQYKYRGHTISFPQEIKDVAKTLPRHINNLDLMVVVRKKGRQGSSYDFTVRKQKVMDALLYKIQNDPYYQDVRVDYDAVEKLPENATDISHMLNSVTLPDIDDETEFAMLEGRPGVDDMLDGLQTTSFASRLPSAPREIEIIRSWENNPNPDESNANEELTNVLNWPGIGSSPINEYNTVGLFDMAFPTLFPKGEADWLQP